MGINHRKEDEVVIIYLHGNIDSFHVKELNLAIEKIIHNEKRCDIIISLLDVDDISSSGLHMLVTVMDGLKKRSEYLILTDLNRFVENILKRVQLYDIFTIMNTEKDALEFLTARRKPLM